LETGAVAVLEAELVAGRAVGAGVGVDVVRGVAPAADAAGFASGWNGAEGCYCACWSS